MLFLFSIQVCKQLSYCRCISSGQAVRTLSHVLCKYWWGRGEKLTHDSFCSGRTGGDLSSHAVSLLPFSFFKPINERQMHFLDIGRAVSLQKSRSHKNENLQVVFGLPKQLIMLRVRLWAFQLEELVLVSLDWVVLNLLLPPSRSQKALWKICPTLLCTLPAGCYMALMDRMQVGKITTTSGKARMQAEMLFWKVTT